MHISVIGLWERYRAISTERLPVAPPPAWHFCDNQADADACAALVLAGRKRATTPSLWFFESRGLTIPSVGDLDIVTSWAGVAECIIRTTVVEVVRFRDITAEYASIEGEGDGTLEYWRTVHWTYYQRELAGTVYRPAEDMPLVCQRFEMVYSR